MTTQPDRQDSDGLLARASGCAIYNFDSVEFVECKHALWNEILEVISATPPKSAPAPVQQGRDISPDYVMAALHKAGLWQVRTLVTTQWKDGNDIDEPSFNAMEFARALLATPQPADERCKNCTADNCAYIKGGYGRCRETFYTILTKYYPNDATFDTLWQELREAGMVP